MNFQTMNKQRKMILIAAAIGAICMFLPWVSVFGYSVNGMHGGGVVVFLCFLAAGALSFMGDQTTNLDQKSWVLTLIAGGLASLIMLIHFLNSMSALGYLGIGFYGALIAAFCVLAFTYMHRSAGYSLQSGLDTLKNSFGNQPGTSRTDTNANANTKVINPTNDPSKPVV